MSQVNFDKESIVKEFVLTTKEGKALQTIRFTVEGRYYSAFNLSGVSPRDGQKLCEFLAENMLNLVESTYIKDGVETSSMVVEAPFSL
mgnify:CR=1 FL=1